MEKNNIKSNKKTTRFAKKPKKQPHEISICVINDQKAGAEGMSSRKLTLTLTLTLTITLLPAVLSPIPLLAQALHHKTLIPK